jgi:kumamolisin
LDACLVLAHRKGEVMSELVRLKGSERGKPLGRFLRDAPGNDPIEITVTLRPMTPLPDVVDPYAPPKTVEQIEAQYGASETDAKQVETELHKYGFESEERSLGARSLKLKGTVAQAEAAFGTKLALYHSDEYGEFRGREGDLKVPAAIADVVTGVFGLDTRKVARRRKSRDAAAATTNQGLKPTDLAGMYGFGSATAAGRTIAILEFGGAYIANDLNLFCRDVGIAMPTVTTSGPQTGPTDDATGEVMMDIQIVAAMAQGAHINVYFAHFTQKGWVNLLQSIIHSKGPKPDAISISYGIAEASKSFSENGMKVIDGYFNELAQMGITVCVSAGDDGCGSLIFDGSANANFPASSPNVLAVGGTMLDAGGNEVTWWETPGRRFDANGNSTGGGSTGGGTSIIFPRPSWQTVTTASLNDGSTAFRCVPDVAALAGPPFYFLILNEQVAPNGGTSASAPMWASVIGCLKKAGKTFGFLTPVFYSSNGAGGTIGSALLKDITQGNNASNPPSTGYEAGPGYDAVTGWGVPDVQAMIASPLIR